MIKHAGSCLEIGRGQFEHLLLFRSNIYVFQCFLVDTLYRQPYMPNVPNPIYQTPYIPKMYGCAGVITVRRRREALFGKII